MKCMPSFFSDERGPFGRNAAPTAAIRNAVRDAGSDVPVVLTGGIHNFEMAEDYLARGDATLSARRGNRWPIRIGSEKLSSASAARFACANTPITARGVDQKHKAVTCKLWDKLPSADRERRTPDGKRRLTAPAWHAPDRRS